MHSTQAVQCSVLLLASRAHAGMPQIRAEEEKKMDPLCALSVQECIVWPAEIAPPERERETCGPEATITGLKER
jgi:hypothetical protein